MRWPVWSFNWHSIARMRWMRLQVTRWLYFVHRAFRRDPSWSIPAATGGLGVLLMVTLLLLQLVSGDGVKSSKPPPADAPLSNTAFAAPPRQIENLPQSTSFPAVSEQPEASEPLQSDQNVPTRQNGDWDITKPTDDVPFTFRPIDKHEAEEPDRPSRNVPDDDSDVAAPQEPADDLFRIPPADIPSDDAVEERTPSDPPSGFEEPLPGREPGEEPSRDSAPFDADDAPAFPFQPVEPIEPVPAEPLPLESDPFGANPFDWPVDEPEPADSPPAKKEPAESEFQAPSVAEPKPLVEPQPTESDPVPPAWEAPPDLPSPVIDPSPALDDPVDTISEPEKASLPPPVDRSGVDLQLKIDRLAVDAAVIAEGQHLGPADRFTITSEPVLSEGDEKGPQGLDDAPNAFRLWHPFDTAHVKTIEVPPPYQGLPPNSPETRPADSELQSDSPPSSETLKIAVKRLASERWLSYQPARYSLVIENRGTHPIGRMIVEETIPSAYRVTDVSPPASRQDQILRWTLENLKPGETETLTVEVFPLEAGPVDSRTKVILTMAASSKTRILAQPQRRRTTVPATPAAPPSAPRPCPQRIYYIDWCGPVRAGSY